MDVNVYARDENGVLCELSLAPHEAISLHCYGAINHKQSLMQSGLAMRAAVEECSSYTQLELLMENLGLLDKYVSFLDANTFEEISLPEEISQASESLISETGEE